MASTLYNISVFKDKDLLGKTAGGKPVGYKQRRFAADNLMKPGVYFILSYRIQRGCRFIKNYKGAFL